MKVIMSNTKVSAFGVTKSDVKDIVDMYIRQYPISEFYFNPAQGVTVLVTKMFPNANTVRVSTAVMSPDEVKYRKSVGKYLAVTNMANMQYINVPEYMLFNVLQGFGGIV